MLTVNRTVEQALKYISLDTDVIVLPEQVIRCVKTLTTAKASGPYKIVHELEVYEIKVHVSHFQNFIQ